MIDYCPFVVSKSNHSKYFFLRLLKRDRTATHADSNILIERFKERWIPDRCGQGDIPVRVDSLPAFLYFWPRISVWRI
jgi:hypothetical protein